MSLVTLGLGPYKLAPTYGLGPEAGFDPLFRVPPNPTRAAAAATATFGALALQVTPFPIEAGTLVVAEFTSAGFIYLKNLWRANEPQDVVEEVRPKRTRELPLPQTLDEVPGHRPDRLPTLDCW